MHSDFLARPLRRRAARFAALFAAVSAAVLAPRPVQAQAQAGTQHVDVCTRVACSASGQPAAAFAEPAQTRARPAAPPSAALPSTVRPSTAADRSTPAVSTRDPWARRFQGRAADDDGACLLNIGLDGELTRGGALATHVLGRTQAWRDPQR